MDILSKRIRDLRVDSDINQAEMGAALGITQNMVSNYENGREPKMETVLLYAKHFDVSADWLLGLTNDKKAITGTFSDSFTPLSQLAGDSAPTASSVAALLKAAEQYYQKGAPCGDIPMTALAGFMDHLRGALEAATAGNVAALLDGVNAATVAALGVTRMVGEFFQRSDELDVLPMAARANGKHIAKRRTVIQPDEAMEKALLERESDPIG